MPALHQGDINDKTLRAPVLFGASCIFVRAAPSHQLQSIRRRFLDVVDHDHVDGGFLWGQLQPQLLLHCLV